MKYCSILLFLIISLFGLFSHAHTFTYTRATLFALDTRERRLCADLKNRLLQLSDSPKAETLCEGDNRNPFTYILVYGEINKSEFHAESGTKETVEEIMVPIAADKVMGHNMRLRGRRQANKVDIISTESLPQLQHRSIPKVLSYPFVLKSISTPDKQNLVARILQLKVNSSDRPPKNEKRSSRGITIKALINEAFQKVFENDNAFIEVYLPTDNCASPTICPEDDDLNLGIKISIKF